MVPDFQPMLATTGVPTNLGGWSVEPKLDGWRARVLVDADHLRVLTRNGNDITANTPELQRLATIGRRMVLDGELITGAGRLSDFYAVAGRLAGRPRASSSPVTFAPFDALWLDGQDLTEEPYHRRRNALESLGIDGPNIRIVPRYPGEDALRLYQACDGHGLEGIVLKDLQSKYLPGQRSSAWRKVKCGAWASHAERRRPPPR